MSETSTPSTPRQPPTSGAFTPPLGPRPPGGRWWPRLPAGLVVAAAAVLPGFLLGIHLAGLIFFLNPDLPFATGPLLRGVAVYGLLLGGVGSAVSYPLLRRRPERARRYLPWALTAVLAGAAVLDLSHASHLAFYVPPGINRRLLKAAVGLSLAALVAFYTALLHTLARRPYGRRSRWGFVALVLLSVFVMVERREAFQPGPPSSPRPSRVAQVPRPTLVVVGLEGATLDAVLPLASQGRLPFLASVVEGGAYGRLASIPPHRRKALWTTLATGKYPYKHGLIGEESFPAPLLAPGGALDLLPAGLGFRLWGTLGAEPRPTDAGDRGVLAVWQVLPRLGMGTGVVGWPASGPVSPEPVFAISDLYFAEPDAAGAARPSGLAARARLFRQHADELDPLTVASFGDEAPPTLTAALAADVSRFQLASLLFQQYRQAEALFLELDGLSTVSLDSLGGYAAVQFEGAQRPEDQRAARRVAAYYAQLDLMLSRLWERTPSPKLLAVVSAYGAEPSQGWRRAWREIVLGDGLGAGYGGSPDGVLLLYGEGIEAGTLLTGATLVDVVPTLVYGAGLPVARDLDGRVLTAAFEKRFLAGHPLTFLPSYETLEGEE